MANYILFTDKDGQERIIRTQYPVFTATIKGYYDTGCSYASKAFDTPEGKKKVCLDESFQDVPDSKVQWALNRAVGYYLRAKKVGG